MNLLSDRRFDRAFQSHYNGVKNPDSLFYQALAHYRAVYRVKKHGLSHELQRAIAHLSLNKLSKGMSGRR